MGACRAKTREEQDFETYVPVVNSLGLTFYLYKQRQNPISDISQQINPQRLSGCKCTNSTF